MQRDIAVRSCAHLVLVAVLQLSAMTPPSTLTLACRALALLSCTASHAYLVSRSGAVPSLVAVLQSAAAASSSSLAINACCTLYCIFGMCPAALNSAVALTVMPAVEAAIAVHRHVPQLESRGRALSLLALLQHSLSDETPEVPEPSLTASVAQPPLPVSQPPAAMMTAMPLAPAPTPAVPIGSSSAALQSAQPLNDGLGDLFALLGMAPATEAEGDAPSSQPALAPAAAAAPTSRLRVDASEFSPALSDGDGATAVSPPSTSAPDAALPASLPPVPSLAVQKLLADAAAPAPPVVYDDADDEPPTCIICLDAPSSVVLMPCCHMPLCKAKDCAAMLGSPQRCPLCRAGVDSTMAVAAPPVKWVPPSMVARGAAALPPSPPPPRCAGDCGAGVSAMCTLLLPCRHMPLCGEHGCLEAALGQSERRRCPSCKSSVTSMLRVFL